MPPPPLKLTKREIAAGDKASDGDRNGSRRTRADRTGCGGRSPHELPGLTRAAAVKNWIAMRQFRPGMRTRLLFTPSSAPPEGEAAAHAMFDGCSAAPPGFPSEAFLARAAALAQAGHA